MLTRSEKNMAIGFAFGTLAGYLIARHPQAFALAAVEVLREAGERDKKKREAEVIKIRESFEVIDGGPVEAKPRKRWWHRLMFWRK